MSNFQAVYYRNRAGGEPVREFIDALDEESQAAIENQIDRLNLLNDELPHLPFPHSSQVEGELRELRCHYGRQHYRVLYRRSERLLVLLHIFAKRTAKILEREMVMARERWEDFKERMDAERRVPPRAAGHDAPSRRGELAIVLSSLMAAADRRSQMAKQTPIGTSVSEHIARKRTRSKRYREAKERLEPFEQLARIVVMRRARLGLSQKELAERMGTTASVISRIESGQHRTSAETLRRLAKALEGSAVLGFDFGTEDEPELVAL